VLILHRKWLAGARTAAACVSPLSAGCPSALTHLLSCCCWLLQRWTSC
jgi:hypothetical protein